MRERTAREKGRERQDMKFRVWKGLEGAGRRHRDKEHKENGKQWG